MSRVHFLRMLYAFAISPQLYIYIFSIRVFFYRHWRFTGQQWKGGVIFYSTLPLPATHAHSDICLQLCMWDDYHVFLISTLVFIRLLLDEIYHLIDWWCNVCLFTWWCDSRFFVKAIWHGSRVALNSHWLSPLNYSWTDLPSVLVNIFVKIKYFVYFRWFLFL